ncbi:hypothetical protein CEV33_0085 [Brucella grignonensis]|uniref:Uncharacterized protein n=1 Tax=Brucella grignonensis TaxID=94627 RepID=A0A256FMF4_9HYPH|nr:hypothetical protein CEV33_0085 [Brucella grignonensis]
MRAEKLLIDDFSRKSDPIGGWLYSFSIVPVSDRIITD